MPAKKYIVSLSVEESQNLDKLTKASKGVAAKINHAHSRCESPRRRMKRSRDLLHFHDQGGINKLAKRYFRYF
jgi:hypothetical protein